MELGANDQLKIVISQAIVDEVERNIRRKVLDKMYVYRRFLAVIDIEFALEPPTDLVAEVSTYVVAKDVHVIAAAIAAKPDYLVTYDRKHLLDVPEVAARSGLKIVTPDVVVAELRSAE